MGGPGDKLVIGVKTCLFEETLFVHPGWDLCRVQANRRHLPAGGMDGFESGGIVTGESLKRG